MSLSLPAPLPRKGAEADLSVSPFLHDVQIRESPEAQLTDKADLAKWKEASKKTHPKKLSCVSSYLPPLPLCKLADPTPRPHVNSLAERRQRIEEKKAAWAAKRDAAAEE